MGMHKEMTKERRDGKLKRPDAHLVKMNFEKELAKQISLILATIDTDTAKYLVDKFTDLTNLSPYPAVIKKLFPDRVPDEL
jgi:hypothetical protein